MTDSGAGGVIIPRGITLFGEQSYTLGDDSQSKSRWGAFSIGLRHVLYSREPEYVIDGGWEDDAVWEGVIELVHSSQPTQAADVARFDLGVDRVVAKAAEGNVRAKWWLEHAKWPLKRIQPAPAAVAEAKA